MRCSRVRRKLNLNQPVLVTTLHFADPSLFEMTSLMGFDGIWLDMEHHAHSMETAQNLMRAARAGQSDIIVRPAKGEFMRMGRMLEAGAQGIIYPRCDNAAEAAEVVKWAKFPPLGKRGCDGANPDMPYCSMPTAKYIEEANKQTFVVIQIEEEAALSHINEIAAVPGVDALFLGPGDYSAIGGYPGQLDHPKIAEATERIAVAAQRAGIHWGRPVWSAEHAVQYLEMGARFIGGPSDLGMMKKSLESVQEIYAQAGFTFDNRLGGQQFRNEPTNGAPHIRIDNSSSVRS